MGRGGDLQYFFQVERMVVELQIHAALRRAAALRSRAARQKDFESVQQVTQFEQVLQNSQRQLGKLRLQDASTHMTQTKAELTAETTGRTK